MTDSQESLLPLNEELDLDGQRLIVDKRLASGLTGEVYRGKLGEENQEIRVALKAMKPLAFKGARQSFDAEGATLNLMRSYEEAANEEQNIQLRVSPDYYGKGEIGSVPFLVMEFIEGKEIPELLALEEHLPEAQALTAGWHLYRTLHLMHTRLRMTYIDLKFEDLWWVGEATTGQLKMTDFGTLEQIAGDPLDRQNYAAQRGIRRDSLLGGVFLLAMLTGTTVNYSLGELRESAWPVIRRSENLSWGTRKLLRHMLHHNPQARLTDPGEIGRELEKLVARWQQDTEQLTQRSQRYLRRAAQDPESEEGMERASEARLCLGIAMMRADADQSVLQPLIEEADRIMDMSDYLARGQSIFYGRSYPAARKIFEEGRDWSSDITLLSWWSYLARIGEDIPAATFDKETRDEAVKAVEKMREGYGGQRGGWKHAAEQLEMLQPHIDCEGFQLLQAHVLIFGQLEKAQYFRSADQYDACAQAFFTAHEALERLPDGERKILVEDVGDLMPLYQEADILAQTRGLAVAMLAEAEVALRDGQLAFAYEQILTAITLSRDSQEEIDPAQEASTLDRENKKANALLLDVVQATLQAGDYDLVANNAWMIWLLPPREASTRKAFAQANMLLKAKNAVPELDQKSFFTNLQLVLAGNGPTAPVVALLDEAVGVADKNGDAQFLRAAAAFAANLLADSTRAAQLNQLAKKNQKKQEGVINEVIERAKALLALHNIGDRRDYQDYYRELTMKKYVAISNQRRPALQEARTLLVEAAAVSAITGDFGDENIKSLAESVNAELANMEAESKAVEKRGQEIKEELQQREGALNTRYESLLANGNNEKAAGDALREDYEKLIIDCFGYLTRVDAEDEALANIRDSAVSRLDWFGLAGWQGVLNTASGQIRQIQERLQKAKGYFKTGNLAAATALIDNLQREHGGGNADWQEVAGQLQDAQVWRAWQTGHKTLLDAGGYSPAILQELRQEWLAPSFQLPQHFWDDSAIPTYIKTLAGKVAPAVEKQLPILRSPGFVNTFRAWFDVEMTAQLLPGYQSGTTKRQWPGLAPFLAAAVRAGDNDMGQMKNLLRNTSTPPDVEATLAAMEENAWSAAVRTVPPPQQELETEPIHPLIYVAIAVLLLFLCSAGGLSAAGYFKGQGPLASLFLTEADKNATVIAASAMTATATMVTSVIDFAPPTLMPSETPTPTASQTPSPTPMETPTPTPTPTPVPQILAAGSSRYSILAEAAADIQPPAPIRASEYWVLPLEEATKSIPFSEGAVWGLENQEGIGDFHYVNPAVRPVDINWAMDKYLNEGLYQLYILDTVKQSGGAYSFQVLLNGEPVEPYVGTGDVIFQHPDNGGQHLDDWIPIGAYEVQTGQTLGVRIQVEGGEARALPFAAPYILVAQVGERERTMLEGLPLKKEGDGRILYSLLDDQFLEAVQSVKPGGPPITFVTSTNYSNWSFEDPNFPLVWGNGFLSKNLQLTIDLGSRIELAAIGRLPAGLYELQAWIPAEHATAFAEYTLVVNGEEVRVETPRTILQSSPGVLVSSEDETADGGAWVTLGTDWSITEESTVGVRIYALHSENLANNPGYKVAGDTVELGVDAVVLLRLGDQ